MLWEDDSLLYNSLNTNNDSWSFKAKVVKVHLPNFEGEGWSCLRWLLAPQMHANQSWNSCSVVKASFNGRLDTRRLGVNKLRTGLRVNETKNEQGDIHFAGQIRAASKHPSLSWQELTTYRFDPESSEILVTQLHSSNRNFMCCKWKLGKIW